MSKKYKSILFVALLFLSITFIKAQDYSFKPIYSTILDSSKGKELMKQCTRCTPQDAKIFWNVAQADVNELEKNFKKVLKVKSSSCEIPDTQIKMLDGYLYQYIGVHVGSKKMIYINAFQGRDTKDVWKKEPVNACDGGISFWGVLFDLENLEFSQL